MGRINSKIDIGLNYLSGSKPWLGNGNFDLSKIRETLRYLDNPHEAIRSIHIAGTNGKGSTSAAIASVLGAAGYKVGLNISPHLSKLNERIVIDGLQVSDEWLGEFAYEVRKASEKALVSLSFHEVITCAAFLGFRESGLEWGVYEVGLGGRLDASNVLTKPEITCITSIDFDHEDILGRTLPEIAREKAGIIKKGVPLVLGKVKQEVSKAIFENPNKSKILSFSSDFGAEEITLNEKGIASFSFWDREPGKILGRVECSLAGEHQVINASLALKMALDCGVSFEIARAGVGDVFWPARLERFVYRDKDIILDCAHNPGGIITLLNYLKSLRLERVHLAFGVLETKNWHEMLKLLVPKAETISLLSPDSERALPNQTLIEELSKTKRVCTNYKREYERFIKELAECIEIV